MSMNARHGFYVKNLALTNFCVWVLIVVSVSIGGCSKGTKEYYPSADFEECETVYVGWSTATPDFTKDLVKTLSIYEHVTLVYDGGKKNEKKIQNDLLQEGVDLKNIDFLSLEIPKASFWLRDHFPVFLYDKKGREKLLLMNRYPEGDWLMKKFPFKSKTRLSGNDLFRSIGGAREFNGKGTVILVRQYEKYINADCFTDQIEFYYKNAFNQTNIIWLNKGLVTDESKGGIDGDFYYEFAGTNGHVDEFCRFVNDSTVLLAEVDSILASTDELMHETYLRMEENYQILQNARLQDGRKINIVRVPVAPIILGENGTRNGEKKLSVLVSSYLNFLITDKVIVLPSYDNYVDSSGSYQKADEKTASVFKKLAPNHKIVFCDAYKLNASGGGFHCVSYNKTRKRKCS
ncbi:agmatine deiminase family protein [Mangrovibacterium sp.]|uniref:agmatine deiminase family protein n=1 Tax=Mangrovibacterium sp. TaxID=1961364 RepID=UPI00356AFDB9